MAWPITVIKKVNVFCVTCFENKVFKTKQKQKNICKDFQICCVGYEVMAK